MTISGGSLCAGTCNETKGRCEPSSSRQMRRSHVAGQQVDQLEGVPGREEEHERLQQEEEEARDEGGGGGRSVTIQVPT